MLGLVDHSHPAATYLLQDLEIAETPLGQDAVPGPGSIRQAHTADEWIGLDQLETATAIYTRLFSA